jgi:hypothetical protein
MQLFKLKTVKTSIKISLTLAIIGFCVASKTVTAQTSTLASNLIAFDSPEGEKLLIESKSRNDFFSLITQFVTQNNQAYCGVASSVMVLNSLQIPAPEAPQYKPYRVFTQENFFNNEKTAKVITAEVVSRQGMTLDELGGLLASYDVKVQVYHAGDTNLSNQMDLDLDPHDSGSNHLDLDR